MRKVTNVFGIVSASMIVLGAIFKIMHWPGAGPLIVFGTMLFILAFLPLWMILRARESATGKGKALAITSFVVLFFLFIGLVFRVQHWPGAMMMMLFSILLAFVAFLPMLIVNLKAERERRISPVYMICIMAPMIALFGAHGPSRNVLGSYIAIDNDLRRVVNTMESSNERFYMQIETMRSKDESIARPYWEKALQLKRATAVTDQYLCQLRAYIVSAACKIPEDGADTLSLDHIGSIDNYDIPTFIMIGDNPVDPRSGKFTAAELKEKLTEYRTFVMGLLDKADPGKFSLQLGDSYYISSHFSESWETAHFYNMPLASVATTISGLRVQLRQVETNALAAISTDGRNALQGPVLTNADATKAQNP